MRYGEFYIYSNFTLLLIARMFDSFNVFQINLSQLFLGMLTLLFLPILPFMAKDPINRPNKIAMTLILIVTFSPAFYLFMDMIDVSRMLSTHSNLKKFISYISYSVHALAIYICMSNLTTTIWNKVNKIIFYIGIAISIEAIIFYFFLSDYIPKQWIAPKGKFVSLLIRDNVLCGIIAIILFIQSIILFRFGQVKSNFKLFLCGCLAFILLMAAGERSTILAFIVFVILIFYMTPKGKQRKPIPVGLISIFFLVVMVFVQFNLGRETSYFDAESSIDRIVISSIGVKTATDFFPIGAGGNMSSAYIGSYAHNSYLFDVIQEILPTDFRNKYDLFLSFYSDKGRISWHNTYLELVGDIGIVGAIICAALIYFWFKYYTLLKNYLKRNRADPRAALPLLWLCFYLFILITFLFTSQNSYYWVFGFYLYGSLLAIKKYVMSKSPSVLMKAD